MKVLAVDTTSSRGSVALVDGNAVLGEVRLVVQDTHSRVLLPAIELVLKAADLAAPRVDGFAVMVGPGSFTGLRVGISTVQGLALATARPCLGASALEILRVAAGDEAPPLVALRDAFRGEVYWAVFEGAGPVTVRPRLGRFEDVFAEAPEGAAFVGDFALDQRPEIERQVKDARFPSFDPFLAAPLALWAESRFRAGEGRGPESLRPLYVRGPDLRKVST